MSRNSKEQELDLPPCTGLSIGTAAASGQAAPWTKVRPFTSRFRPPGLEVTSDPEPRHIAGRRQPERRRTDFTRVREKQCHQRNRRGSRRRTSDPISLFDWPSRRSRSKAYARSCLARYEAA